MFGTRIENSLLDNQERNLLPVEIAPRGNLATYGQNSFFCGLYYLNAGTPTLLSAAQGEALQVLLFGQDTPIIHALHSFYTATTGPWAFDFWDFREESWIYTNLTGGILITADANNTALEQQATGVTATNGVRVSGHLLVSTIVDRSLVADALPKTTTLKLMCITKGSLNSGPENFYRVATEDRPILLWEPDYTQAMRDAGNVVVDGADTYRIVGLCDTGSRKQA